MDYTSLHTRLRVMALEKSLKFYKEALGFEETRRKDLPKHEFTLVFLSDNVGHFELERTYNYKPEQPYEIGNGYSHLAVGVQDPEASHQKHQDQGYEVEVIKVS